MKFTGQNVRKLLYVFVVFVMLVSTLEYANVKVWGASIACCQFGSDCPQGKGREPILRCCAPGLLEADCSQNKRYYCRESCG